MHWAVVFALLLLSLAAVPVLAEPPPDGNGGSAWLTEIPAPTEAEVAEAELEEHEQSEWLSGPEAEHQRQVSRTAYTDLSTAEAQSLLLEAFSVQLEQLNEDPARVLSGLEVEKPLGTYAARIKGEDGESAILNSSTAVQSDVGGEGLEPVDLTLEQSGDSFVPQNPITETELPGSVEEPIQLQSGIEIELPASNDHGAEPLGDMNLFYPETETATDTLLAPRGSGVEVFEQLRSPESPERFNFPMNLPAEATLRPSEGGGVEVLNAPGEKIEEVPPPSATDAQGAAVPVTTTIEGDTLVLEVPHRSRDVAYPVLLDPGFVNDGTSFGEWVPSENSSYEYPLRNLGSSLSPISRGSNYYYGPNTHGQYAYGAYGETAYIAAATFSPIFFLVNGCNTAQPHGYVGLWNSGANKYDSLGIYSGGKIENAEFQTGWIGGAGTRAAIIGIGTDGTAAQNTCTHELYVGGYSIQEKDPYPPAVSVSGVPGGWFDPAKAGNATVKATDTGLGMHWISMEEIGGGSVHPAISCNGANGSRCSREYSWVVAPPYKQGQRTLQVTAEDPVENIGKWTQTTKVDAEKPEVNLQGQLAYVTEEQGKQGEENDADENVLHLPVYNLKVEATDGNEKGGATEWQSGIKNIEIFLDGAKQSVSWVAQTCVRTEASCPMTESYQLKLLGLAAGVHKLKIVASDQVALAREREIEFEYIPPTGARDEYVTQHFPLPDGQGNEAEEENPIRPELTVNVLNGNLMYRQKDVEVSGPSADLEVERFYNSQLPKEDSTEWGTGWTLAQTPVLQPEEVKSGVPKEAMVVEESGAVESQVKLPTNNGEEVFDIGTHAVITKEPDGYEMADQSGDSADAIAFDEAGEATELRTPGEASVEYEHKGGLLAEISVVDPAAVSGSPEKAAFEEAANEPAVYLEQLGSGGTGNGQFQHPGDVAASTDGSLWVADTYGHRLQKFNGKGEFLLQVTSVGETGKTMNPSGVATDGAGNVYEADWGNSGIYEYSPTGAFLRKIGTVGEGSGQVYRPEDVVVDGKGNVIVADTGNGRLVEFNSKGEWVRNMGTKGNGAEQLGEPTGIDVDAANDVFVADWTNNKVMEYNEAGAYVRKWGEMGSGSTQFNRPDAIAVDAKGDVYVGDQENSSVKEFTGSGEFIRKFGSHGTGPGQFSFSYPMGMDVDKTGAIWVTDPYNQRVERWQTAPEEAPLYLEQLGSGGTGNGQFQHPGDVAASTDGSLWVADTYGHRLQKFNGKGEFLLQVTSVGETGKTMNPSGVATDGAGNVYEADWGNSGIYEYSPTGAFLRKIGTVGEGSGQVYRPEDVVVDGKGNVIVADTGNGRLVEFNSKGEWVRNMGTKGNGAEQLGEPTGIDVDAANDVFVADWTNNKVMEYNEAGAYVRKWGEMGSGSTQFNRPDAIAVDAKGDVYVGDQENSSVKEFTGSGEFIRKFGSHGTGPGQFSFSYPMGMDVDKTGAIWVTDPYNQRVERWAMARESNSGGAPGAQADPSVAVTESSGLVGSVSGKEAGTTIYSHEAEKLTAVNGPNGETKYKYDSLKRLTKVELPRGTWAEIKYESMGRVSSVTVVIEGGKAKTTKFEYVDQLPENFEERETTVIFETEPTVHYLIGPDGSVLKWWNTKVPPEIEQLTGSLYTERGEVHPNSISSGDQTLNVKAHSFEGIVSIQIVANGSDVVAERNCEESKCVKLEKELVTETQNWPPGILQLEVIVTDTKGQISSQRFWDNIPYTQPPEPEALEPPKFEEILRFREEFGLDLDLKGNEQASNERIFELIAAWHDPTSPAGEVARAADERWGVPLRVVDVAEMEYRESYIAKDVPLIESWSGSHYPGQFAGYYVDHHHGGIIHVGFTQSQATALAELKQQVNLIAPDRVAAYETVPTTSRISLASTMEAVEGLLSSNGSLAALITEVGVEEASDTVVVGATDVAQTQSILASQLGGNAPVSVHHETVGLPFAGRNHTTGRILAGDRILNSQPAECTAGFGAWEPLNSKSTNELIVAEFLLVAGHCGAVGEDIRRAPTRSALASEWRTIGTTKRTGAPLGGQNYETDASAVRLLTPDLVPRAIFKTNKTSRAVGPAGTAKHGETLCFSGQKTNDVKCGEMVGVRYRQFGGPGRHLFIITRFAGIPGDSGAPVWNPRTNISVGMLSGGPGVAGLYKDWVTPLVVPRGFSAEKVPGALKAPGMGSLQLTEGG